MVISQDIITSRQNRLVVDTGKLGARKARSETGLFRFDGIKLLTEAVEKGVEIRHILILAGRETRVLSALCGFEQRDALRDAAVHILAEEVFEKLSEEKAPEGVITVAAAPKAHKCGQEAMSMLGETEGGILLLEAVRDPGNLGTILRSAAAFGVGAVAISRDCADLYNSKTVRGAMGALFRLPIAVVDDMLAAIQLLQRRGRRVYAAALDPSACRLAPDVLGRGDCVVVGNEGHGLLPTTVAGCDATLYIPMESGSESLNAAVAASVILWNMYLGR